MFVPVPAQAAPPTPYQAEYEVLRNGKKLGRSVVSLQRVDADTWEYLSHTRGTQGLAGIAGVDIVERSRLRWDSRQPETIDYHFKQQAAWKSRERHLLFEPTAGRIVSRDRDRQYVFAFEPGVLDRQSVSLALSANLVDGHRGDLTYLVADRDEFGPQTYRVGPEETIATPAGALRALRVDRVRSEPGGRSTTTWMGVEQDFLPVRILQREPDGDSFESRLVSLRR